MDSTSRNRRSWIHRKDGRKQHERKQRMEDVFDKCNQVTDLQLPLIDLNTSRPNNQDHHDIEQEEKARLCRCHQAKQAARTRSIGLVDFAKAFFFKFFIDEGTDHS